MNKKIYPKSPSLCNCTNLRRAARAITQFYDELLMPCGLKITQLSLLRHIIRLGPLSMSELADAIRLDRTTLVRNIKLLEAQGLVAVVKGTDSRTRQLMITEKGKNTVDAAAPYWEDAQKIIKDYFGEQDLKVLTGLLSKIESIVP